MDGKRFDGLVRSLDARFSRRSTLGALTALAAAGVLVEAADAKKKCKGNKKKCGNKCIPKSKCCKSSECPANTTCTNGSCKAAANRCPTAFVCIGNGGDAPVCGSEAGGGDCGCYQSTEGNSVCLNQTDINGGSLQECTSTQDCEDGPSGFHFYCRKPLANENGLFCGQSVGRCWPECDNTN